MTTPKAPPKITASYLENAALHYLQRFASSSSNLRRVLMRKIERSIAHWGGERDEHVAQMDAAIARMAELGYVNDTAYAEMKTLALHRKGKAGRTIKATLAAKGVDADMAAAAFQALESAEPDLEAAIRLARKRRLGPFRLGSRPDFRQKDMAALARSGFDFDTIRRVIDAESPEALDELAAG